MTQAEYVVLQGQLVKALREFHDVNPNYVSRRHRREAIFDQIFARPLPEGPGDPPFGLGTNRFIGQDSGDVYAVLSIGYNFDGTQVPAVQRLGDDAAAQGQIRDAGVPGARPLIDRPGERAMIDHHVMHGVMPRLAAIRGALDAQAVAAARIRAVG